MERIQRPLTTKWPQSDILRLSEPARLDLRLACFKQRRASLWGLNWTWFLATVTWDLTFSPASESHTNRMNAGCNAKPCQMGAVEHHTGMSTVFLMTLLRYWHFEREASNVTPPSRPNLPAHVSRYVAEYKQVEDTKLKYHRRVKCFVTRGRQIGDTWKRGLPGDCATAAVQRAAGKPDCHEQEGGKKTHQSQVHKCGKHSGKMEEEKKRLPRRCLVPMGENGALSYTRQCKTRSGHCALI